jgi:hypothetical protein
MIAGAYDWTDDMLKIKSMQKKFRCTAPGSLDTRLHYAARLRLVSRCAARASRGLR